MEFAAAQKMIVLGSAHSHTYRAGRDEVEAIPSIGDMESWEVPDLICGIANVVEGPDGKKKCRDIASYGPPTKLRRDREASWTAHPVMDRHPVLEHQLLMHRNPVCRGGTAIGGVRDPAGRRRGVEDREITTSTIPS